MISYLIDKDSLAAMDMVAKDREHQKMALIDATRIGFLNIELQDRKLWRCHELGSSSFHHTQRKFCRKRL